MNKPLRQRTIALLITVGTLGLAGGCSSSVTPAGPAEVSSPAPSVSDTASVSASPSASPTPSPTKKMSGEPSVNAGAQTRKPDAEDVDNPLSEFEREGTPVQWKKLSLDGAEHTGFIPLETHSGGGTVIWKETQSLSHVSFTAAVADDAPITEPVVVKVITGQSGRPITVKVSKGQPQTVDVPMSSSHIFKIVWALVEQPSDGSSVVFYDFNVEK